MFPFDLPGPQFLLFYALFAAVVLALLYAWQRVAEGGEPPKLSFDDPLAIAYLRGGTDEAIRVAAAALIDRGLLTVEGELLKTGPKGDPAFVRRPLERAVLERARQPMSGDGLVQDATLRRTADVYALELERRGLLPDDRTLAARRRRYLVGLALLWGVAAIKIAIAFTAGRRNVLFLILLAVLVAIFGYALMRGHRTALGDRLLADLRRLFARLRKRAATLVPGAASADALLLAAVFGVSSLPVHSPAYAALRRKSSRDSTSSSCGSSGCGSGDGGAGGCGGGGGCGGCGGS